MPDRYGQTRVTKIKAAFDRHREAVRREGTPAIQETWDRIEPWLDWVHEQKEGET